MKDDEKLQYDIANSVRTMKENMPALIEIEQLRAGLLRQKYIALVRSGFTDVQALELCKAAIN